MDDFITLIVDENTAGTRIDSYLSLMLEDVSRTQAAKLLADGDVKPIRKPSYKVAVGECYEVKIKEPKEMEALPEKMELNILYEDCDVIVVNKPKGMVVHPDNKYSGGTLVNGLLYHCRDLSGIGGVVRPGIVHRIDMDTTGSVIACKNDKAHASIALQLKEHSVNRRYVAIVCGNIKEDEGTINEPIGRSTKDRKKMAVNHQNGKHAITHYRVLERFGDYTYVECRLETGRTHQIRVHMAHIGHPLLGDLVYGREIKKYKNLQGQCLHAKILGFVHPSTGEYVETLAPLPEYFEKLLVELRK